MSSILKSAKKLGKSSSSSSSSSSGSGSSITVKQSSSIGVVRWTLPDEDVRGHSSAPSRPVHNDHLSRRSQQQHPRHNGLKDLRSLQECVLFIQHWKQQVDQVCKTHSASLKRSPSKPGGGTMVCTMSSHATALHTSAGAGDPGDGIGDRESQSSDPRTERSLEESRKLILEWADELDHVDELQKEPPWTPSEGRESPGDEDAQLRIMDWAKELQKVTESCGVQSEELGKVLRLLGLKKKRLTNLLPLLEFITWSLLTEDGTRMIPQIWLLTKQRTWKPGISRYIPNSVWSWICAEKADVLLDPMTNHPWLQLSDDQRKVQEGLYESDLPYNSQRFDSWPCVLGWEGYGRGRRYWEVDIAGKGYWRVGVTTADSKRHGRFSMTPKQGYWALWRSTRQFYACTQPETELPVSLVPTRLGVYVDYEEGQISFYNSETKSHIYTFSGTFKEKLYPMFAPLDGCTVIAVVPPHKISVN